MKRLMFRAQMKEGCEEKVISLLKEEKAAGSLVEDGQAMVFAAYYWEKNIFLYCECLKEELRPEVMFCNIRDYLEDWPGEAVMRKWIPLIDVFHFNEPVSEEHWRRKEPVEDRKGRVAHLKPEMISSYTYYHYQLQEERAFLGAKYDIIGIHENLLFGYQEFPKIVEEPLAAGRLNTSGTPVNWEDARMELHFQPWEDGHLYFKYIEPIFVYHE